MTTIKLLKPLFRFTCLLSTFIFVISFVFSISFISIAFAETSQANLNDTQIVWQRDPIKIILPVGKERYVTFPSEVQFGYNTMLIPDSMLRVENDSQTLYFLAKQPFEKQRAEAKLNDGQIILIDISAEKDAPATPIDIILPTNNNTASNDQSNNGNNGNKSDSNNSQINYVSLTRFAVQQLYAPERLLKNPLSISRFPMETSHVIPLFSDDSASAMPLASWQSNNLYVTAILIKNTLNQPLRLDPRLLCGDWKTASFFPQTELEPLGTPMNRDTSTLFVVSDHSFSQAIQACLT